MHKYLDNAAGISFFVDCIKKRHIDTFPTVKEIARVARYY